MLELILARLRTGPVSAADQPGTAEARLHGRPLLLARAVWLTSFVAILLIVAVSIPAYWAYLHTLRSSSLDIYAGQLTPGELAGLLASGLSLDGYAAYLVGLKAFFVSVWLVIGAVIFWRKSADRMALFASFTLVTFSVSFSYWAQAVLPTWALLLQIVNFVSGVSLGLFLWVFPDGRFVPRWTRWPIILISLVHGVYSTLLAAPLAALPLLSTLDGLVFLTVLIGVLAVQVYRYRRVSTAGQRQQTKWAVFGFALAMLGFVSAIVLGALLPASYVPGTLFYLGVSTLLYLALLCIPLFIGVAILRAHLWDIDLLINRTLVYGALTASITGLYGLMVATLSTLFPTSGNGLIALPAAGVIAVLFAPLRDRLQRGVNRLMYGERDDPYRVLARLGERLEGTLAPDAIFPVIVETIARSLKLPYVGLALTQGQGCRLAAAHGQPQVPLLTLPLTYHTEPIGELRLAPRRPGEPFTLPDRRLLADLARQVGVAVHAVRLSADLQRSRERLVTAREEERRRLRRDLHDGLGPRLASLTLKLEALQNRVAPDPLAEALLTEVTSQMQAAIADIRRLVYALRPSVLDELGLAAALREAVAQYNLPRADRVRITVEAPQTLPPLPAAVEVAAYRIAQEALTNVVRHAQARTCGVRLTLDQGRSLLTLEIVDDGRGLAPDHGTGVGLASMRERAEELGGMCRVAPLAGGGTRVHVQLPCVIAEVTCEEGAALLPAPAGKE